MDCIVWQCSRGNRSGVAEGMANIAQERRPPTFKRGSASRGTGGHARDLCQQSRVAGTCKGQGLTEQTEISLASRLPDLLDVSPDVGLRPVQVGKPILVCEPTGADRSLVPSCTVGVRRQSCYAAADIAR